MALPILAALSGLSGISNLFSGMSSSRRERQLMDEQAAMLREQRQQYQQYGVPALRMLSGIAQDPSSDPWYTAQMHNAEGDVHRYMTSGLSNLSGGYSERGLGRGSWAQNDRNAIAAQGLGALANARVGQLQDMQGQRMQAVQAMMGLLNNSQPNMLPLAQMYGNQANQAMQGLGQLGSVAGYLWPQQQPAAAQASAGANYGNIGGMYYRPTPAEQVVEEPMGTGLGYPMGNNAYNMSSLSQLTPYDPDLFRRRY